MTSRAAAVARRYGRALLDLAAGDASGPEGVRQRLQRLADLLHQHPRASKILAHPGIPSGRKDQLLAAMLPEEGTDGLVTRLMRLLIERRRLALLPAILESYVSQWNEQRGVVAARVLCASQLDARQLAALETALAKATKASVELTVEVEPRLGGGLLVNVGGRTLDGSVRGRLRILRERLRQAAVVR